MQLYACEMLRKYFDDKCMEPGNMPDINPLRLFTSQSIFVVNQHM